jgi:hypothetical protein
MPFSDMKPMTFFEVLSAFEGPTSGTREWESKARGLFGCAECRSILPSLKEVDVQLELDPNDYELTIHWVYFYSLGYARKVFLEALLGQDRDLFCFGKVYGPNGSLLRDYATYRFKGDRIIVRGDERSRCRRCGVCGRALYAPFGRKYVLTRDIRNREIIETDGTSLLVTEEVENRLKTKKWRNVKISRMKSLEEPKDRFDPALQLYSI